MPTCMNTKDSNVLQPLVITALYVFYRPQRRNVWASLTMDQLRYSDNELIILKHKTVLSHGPLVITFSGVLKDIVDKWIVVRQEWLNQEKMVLNEDLLFLNARGGVRDIRKDLQATFADKAVTTRSVRKGYRTQLENKTSREDLIVMDRADAHSPATVAQHYVANQNTVFERRINSQAADYFYNRVFPIASQIQKIAPPPPLPPGL
jgi:integrase